MHQKPHPRGRASRLAAVATVAALAVAPGLARAQGSDPEWRAGAGLGASFGMGDEDYSALTVRIDAQRSYRELSPQARLDLVVSLGMSHPADSATVPIGFDPYLGTLRTAEITWDANVLELVPAARISYAASPTVAFYADGGLGLTYTATRVDLPPEAEVLGLSGGPGDGAGAVLRIGGGLLWTPSPAVRVALEVVGLHARFGGGLGSSFDLVASISHRL